MIPQTTFTGAKPPRTTITAARDRKAAKRSNWSTAWATEPHPSGIRRGPPPSLRTLPCPSHFIAFGLQRAQFTVDLAYPPVVSFASSSVVIASASASPGGGGGGGCGLYGHQQQQQLVLSGEIWIVKLKSPKSSAGPTLNKAQIDSALDFLADWVYECCGSVSFSSLEHPKFKAFLTQVGLPAISRRELVWSRLDGKYEEARAESEAKIRDAMFFQIAADGWKLKDHVHVGEENCVHLAVNLPNGTSVFRRAVFTTGYVPSKYAEEIMWETITEICGNAVQQCVG
ncbi:UNVERIFIED_CONTAM: hypothetical protein Slati_4305700 [Sesamum latifolium]|uniref:Uncharacterized protein n=1 Tax=Sesamum latifolium TaxID=2727402 RepID=A0AAW2SLJ9_9LAMI